jgi:hypothetical protein
VSIELPMIDEARTGHWSLVSGHAGQPCRNRAWTRVFPPIPLALALLPWTEYGARAEKADWQRGQKPPEGSSLVRVRHVDRVTDCTLAGLWKTLYTGRAYTVQRHKISRCLTSESQVLGAVPVSSQR